MLCSPPGRGEVGSVGRTRSSDPGRARGGFGAAARVAAAPITGAHEPGGGGAPVGAGDVDGAGRSARCVGCDAAVYRAAATLDLCLARRGSDRGGVGGTASGGGAGCSVWAEPGAFGGGAFIESRRLGEMAARWLGGARVAGGVALWSALDDLSRSARRAEPAYDSRAPVVVGAVGGGGAARDVGAGAGAGGAGGDSQACGHADSGADFGACGRSRAAGAAASGGCAAPVGGAGGDGGVVAARGVGS